MTAQPTRPGPATDLPDPPSNELQSTWTQPTRGSAPGVRTVLVNSVIAAVLGAGLMVVVHEAAHLLAGLALGIPGTQYSYGVEQNGVMTPAQTALTAMAAPIFSAVTGAVMAWWTPLRRRGGFGHLLWLWFAFTSLMEGVAYLVITPFGAGDTADTARALGLGVPVQFVAMAVGIGLMFVVARVFAPHLGRMAGPDRRVRNAYGLFTWLFGSLLGGALALLNLATAGMALGVGEQIVIVLAASVVLVHAPMAMIFAKAMNAQPYEPLRLAPVPRIALGTLVLLVVLNVTVLAAGVAVG